MQQNRNFYVTIALSVLILMVWQIFYMNPKIKAQQEQARIEATRVAGEASKTTAGGNIKAPATGTEAAAAAGVTLNDALKQSARVIIDTPSLRGSINLVGARFDDVVLKNYHETVDDSSPSIQLLAPSPVPNGYFAELGFAGEAAVGTLPGAETVWTVSGNTTLTPTAPVILTYTNDKALTFKRTIAVDSRYMFTINDSVTNGGATAVSLASYGRVVRYEKPATASVYVLHEGAIGYDDINHLQEHNFANLESDKEVKPEKASNGWLGITDKYWAAALVPTQKVPHQTKYSYFSEGRPRYQVDYLTDAISVAPGETQTSEALLFAGAKDVNVINAYRDERSITNFDRMVDWGWFWFITKPMFWLMDHLFKLLGNFGLAILATTVVVKAIFFPLANKSYVSMAHMKTAQPKMAEIKE